MVWRRAHGNATKVGRQRDRVFEVTPDGVQPVPPGAAEPHGRRPDGTVTAEGAAMLARRRWELDRMPDFGDSAAPWLPPAADLAPYDQARRELLVQRRDEIAKMTGGVSSGVGAALRGWAYLHAAAEYWAAKFFAGDANAFEPMTRAVKAASAEDARVRDAAAWEAKSRPQLSPRERLEREVAAMRAAKAKEST